MNATLSKTLISLAATALMVGCGGGSGGDTTTTTAPTPVAPIPVAPAPVTPTPVTPTPAVTPLAKKAAALAALLGKPNRLLVGLGGTNEPASMVSQGIKPDILERYLNGIGSTSWPNWNSPTGAYVGVVGALADSFGAVPMFTLYQMAAWGDGNLSGLSDTAYMQSYWDNVRILFRQLKTYGKPALVNMEPDFWGYAQRLSSDPTKPFVHVNSTNADCANQPNTVAGMAACLLQMARAGAPKAYVGFSPSGFLDLAATEMNYYKQLGAAKADFVVMQTSDRDAGCFEANYTANNAMCVRFNPNPFYWDASNLTTPSFTSHLAYVRSFHEGLELPILWWQTPMGVPSTTPGGTAYAFRDNRVQYFLTHPSELVAAGGVGVVFGPGQAVQTNIDTDGGQFKRLSTQYFSAPAALP